MTEQAKQNEAISDMLNTASEERNASSAELHALHSRVSNVEKTLITNTAMTESVGKDTSELLDLFRAAKGGFKVMGWLGEGLKWVGIVVAALTSIWVAFHLDGGPK